MLIFALLLALITPCQASELIESCYDLPNSKFKNLLLIKGDITHELENGILILHVPQGMKSIFSYTQMGSTFTCSYEPYEDTAPFDPQTTLSWAHATSNPLDDQTPQSYTHSLEKGITSFTHQFSFYPYQKELPGFWDLFSSLFFQTTCLDKTEVTWHFTPLNPQQTALFLTAKNPPKKATITLKLQKSTKIETSWTNHDLNKSF